MTQGTARDGRQDRHASFWELHFNDPDVGAFLSEAVSEFVDDIGGPGRGISWAITTAQVRGGPHPDRGQRTGAGRGRSAAFLRRRAGPHGGS